MTEDIRDSAAADEQSAERQRVRGEDPLLASLAKSQCGANRRERHRDDRHVKDHDELSDAHEGNGWPGFPTVTSKAAHTGNIPSCRERMRLVN